MAEVTLTIPGEPIAQPRQRHGIVAGRVRNWTPTKHPANAFKAAIRLAWGQSGGTLTDGPVVMKVDLLFPRPKSKVWKTKPMPREPHVSRPDAENVCKAVLDALSGLAYRDDSQVCQLWIVKEIAAGDEAPRTEISVRALA